MISPYQPARLGLYRRPQVANKGRITIVTKIATTVAMTSAASFLCIL